MGAINDTLNLYKWLLTFLKSVHHRQNPARHYNLNALEQEKLVSFWKGPSGAESLDVTGNRVPRRSSSHGWADHSGIRRALAEACHWPMTLSLQGSGFII
jgi:hypothetical protein